ncbi:SCO family protein [Paracoccus sp. (in: a-proteobacteria)]|uniref:SCO family protein n=1 Tax=Paracoccus sp. TaxID=267 RepID=UPI003A891F90
MSRLALVGMVLLAFGLFARDGPPPHFSAAFPAGEDFQFAPPEPGSYALPPIRTAPDGMVLDKDGRAQRLAALTWGRISLVSFVYLTCGDVNGCPLAMATLFDIHDASLKVPQLRDKVQLVTISFDPDRDTVGAIASFAWPITADPEAAQKIAWHVLTTASRARLQPILDGYGQVIDRQPDQETISHLLRIYLVDGQGRIRNIYGLGQIDPRLLMTDVETLMMEERRG